MSQTLKFLPHEGTYEIVKGIEAAASTPAFEPAAKGTASQHGIKGKNSQGHTKGNKPFHDKRPK